MEIPFGENPFAYKHTPLENVNVSKAPSPPPITQKAPPLQQRQINGNNQVTMLTKKARLLL